MKPPGTKISKALARNLLNTILSIDKAKKSRSGAPLAAKSTQSYCRSTPQCSTRHEFYSNKALRADRTLQQRETQHEFDKLDGRRRRHRRRAPRKAEESRASDTGTAKADAEPAPRLAERAEPPRAPDARRRNLESVAHEPTALPPPVPDADLGV